MAEKRKLQSEIEKTLKRVDDGIDGFDDLLVKAEEAQTSAQKEKMEGELKRDIKKLQRLRDQIKVWLATPEVKDKPPLEEARKKIEKEMEKFKVCEKLFKIKAFSKEGLAQEKKLGPQEVEREKHRKWIRESLDRLNTEIDSHEAEIEKYKTLRKGRIKGPDAESISQLEQWANRHKWHVAKLEKVLRRLENNDIDMSQLDDLNETLDYYLDSFQDPEYFHDLDMYFQYGLEDTLEDQSFAPNHESDSLDGEEDFALESGAVSHSSFTTGESIGSTTIKKTPGVVSAPVVVPSTVRRLRHESSGESELAHAVIASAAPPTIAATTVSASSVIKVQPTGRPSWSPAVSYAEAIKSSLPSSQLGAIQHEILPQTSQTQIQSQPRSQQLPAQSQLSRSAENFWKTDKIEKPQQQQPSEQPSQAVLQPSSLPPSPQAKATSSSQQQEQPSDAPYLDLLLSIVDAAHKALPDIKHRRHFRYYQPKTIWSNPPSSFPKYPLKGFATPQFFHKLDLDTLFFTFYHQQGTYQQYLAARELKRQNWRYHKKYLTWFQPQEGPKIVTDKFHRGAWMYFDSEAGWCSRVKHDFTFEFSFLENEMPIPTPLHDVHPIQEIHQPITTTLDHIQMTNSIINSTVNHQLPI